MTSQKINSFRLYDVLKSPLVTEKSTGAQNFNKIFFEVDLKAEKEEIKQAVETIFNVKVDKVNTILLKGKKKVFRGRIGRQSDRKKAVVTLADGHTLDVTAGI